MPQRLHDKNFKWPDSGTIYVHKALKASKPCNIINPTKNCKEYEKTKKTTTKGRQAYNGRYFRIKLISNVH